MPRQGPSKAAYHPVDKEQLYRMKLTLWAAIGHALAPLAQHLLASQPVAALAGQALLLVAATRWAQAIDWVRVRVRPEMHSPMLLELQEKLLQQIWPASTWVLPQQKRRRPSCSPSARLLRLTPASPTQPGLAAGTSPLPCPQAEVLPLDQTSCLQ